MLFYYIRHGNPIYDPDSLTPLGHEQAKAISKRLNLFGLDKIYSSTSNRAMLTARPTCDLIRKEPTLLDFAHEDRAWENFSLVNDEGLRTWCFYIPKFKLLFTDPEVIRLGFDWYNHPQLKEYGFKKGVEKAYDDVDRFIASLGYEHERYTGRYKIVNENNERVALFAHAGFGVLFISALLDIPYPRVAMHFDMQQTGMTVINFERVGDYAIPKVLTYSNDAHLYKEGLPTRYNNSPRLVF
jgi:probable phosphoglycerate mutase